MDIAPITIWREAGGEGPEGMAAVAWVIHNRALSGRRMWPQDAEKVCLQAYQFSCWNTNDATRNKYPVAGDAAYRDAMQAWAMVGNGPDPTHGAFYYVNPQAVSVNPFDNANYVKTAEIGRHHFYREA